MPQLNGDGRTRWPVVAVTLVAAIVAASYIGKAPAAVPSLRTDLGLGMVAAGWAVSMFNALGSLVGILAGTAADSLGHRRLAMVGLLALIVGGLTGGLCWNDLLFLLGRAIEGIGFISVAVSAPGLIMAATAVEDRRFAFGLLGIYMPTGVALALALSPYVIETAGWRALWLAIAMVTLAALLLLSRMTRRPGATPRPRHAPSLADRANGPARVLKSHGLWWLSLAFGAYTLQWTSLMMWLPTFLMESRQLSPLVAAELTALVVMANIPGIVVGAWLSRRGTRLWCLVAGASVAMGICTLGIFSDGVGDGPRFLLCLIFSAAGGLLPSGVLGGAAVHAPTPQLIGAANGMVLQGSNLGQFLGPAMIAALVSATGSWSAPMWLMLTAASLGVLAGIAAERAERTGRSNLQRR